MVDCSDSSSGCSEIRKPMMRKREIDDDYEEEIPGTEAMMRRRKQRKRNKSPFVSSSSSSPTEKMIWTKNNELVILKGIVDYENEKGLSYGSDWEVFYGYVKGLIDVDFSKTQLENKVRRMKRRFSDIIARSKDGKALSFTTTDDEQVFRLLSNIWGKNMQDKDQPKEVHVSMKDVPCADHEPMRMEKENTSEEEDGVDALCVLQECLEGMTVFQTFGKYQQKVLCRNLKNLPAQRKKELADEWKALLDEEMKLNIKKLNFAAKLANASA